MTLYDTQLKLGNRVSKTDADEVLRDWIKFVFDLDDVGDLLSVRVFYFLLDNSEVQKQLTTIR